MAACGPCTPFRTSILFIACLLIEAMLCYRHSSVTCMSTKSSSERASLLTDGLPNETPTSSTSKLLRHVPKAAQSESLEHHVLRRPRRSVNHLSMKKLQNTRDDGESLSCNWQQDLEITQDSYGYLPDGMPIFHVTVTNTCMTCFFWNIHISCGEFASATVVDPALFRRVADNDCIIKNGGRMDPMTTLFFEYVSLFPFTMDVAGAVSSCE